jgi:electron transfer flavoprotein alpha subunit
MIITFVEHDQGQLSAHTLETLTFARGLAEGLGTSLHALIIGGEAAPAAEALAAYGVATIHLARHERLNAYAPEAWAACLAQSIERLQPAAALAAADQRGGEVLAHAAARLGLPLAANCIEAVPGDPLRVTRQRWGGSLLEEADLHGAVKLLTVAAHILAPQPAGAAGAASVEEFAPALDESLFRARVTGRVEAEAGKVSLTEAKVVIGGGRGVGSAESFDLLEELAGLLGGAVGCSRAVTSLGWRPHTDQVGQTGNQIAPEIYIACGISGAIQHMVGCKGAKHILAINIDPDAPIVARADYAIIGDLLQVVPALSAEVRRAQSQ